MRLHRQGGCSLPQSLALPAIGLAAVLLITGCRAQPAEIPPTDNPTPSPSMSGLGVSEDSLAVGDTATLSLQARDAEGLPIAAGGLTVEFRVESGSSDLGIGPTQDHGDGTYTAVFEAEGTGTPARIGATMDGVAVTSDLPTVTVVAGPPSPGDADGDGVPDAEDECPNDPGPASNGGCPEEEPPPPPTDQDGDGVADPDDECPTEPGPASNGGCPEPPPAGGCEAGAPARCWYVNAAQATDGDGSEASPFRLPQTAVTRANPGDFIYLRGTFTLSHGVSGPAGGTLLFNPASGGRDGASGALITVKPWPGFSAISQGSGASRLDVTLNRSYWRLEGLRVEEGVIFVAWYFVTGVHDVWVVGNEVGPADADAGNFGLIRVHGGPDSPGTAYNVFVWDNTVHDLYDGSLLWSEDPDVEHHSCFMIQNASGLVEFKDNEASRCAAIFYFKYDGPGPAVVTDNYLHDARRLGICRIADQTFEQNTIENVPAVTQNSDRCETR